jgi:hypothetical protein
MEQVEFLERYTPEKDTDMSDRIKVLSDLVGEVSDRLYGNCDTKDFLLWYKFNGEQIVDFDIELMLKSCFEIDYMLDEIKARLTEYKRKIKEL